MEEGKWRRRGLRALEVYLVLLFHFTIGSILISFLTKPEETIRYVLVLGIVIVLLGLVYTRRRRNRTEIR